MRLRIEQRAPGLADGTYRLRAPGAMAAALYWADARGALPGWTALACLPVDPGGEGLFTLAGGRAVPPGATHILVRAVGEALTDPRELLCPLPGLPAPPLGEPRARFMLMSDLHLASKPRPVLRALTLARGYDAALLAGDLVNDGAPEQFRALMDCIEAALPGTPVFAVAGNHDYPAQPSPRLREGLCDYPALQAALLERARALGCACEQDACGAYAAAVAGIEILGLNAVTHFRRFRFPGGEQPAWLARRLASPGGRRILLCHAPLSCHHPRPKPGAQPYLHMDKALRAAIGEAGGVICVSGHTHLSLNLPGGCAGRDASGSIFINAGSVRPTALPPGEALRPASWTSGNAVALELYDRAAVLRGLTVPGGLSISRGYYRFE